VDAAGVVFEYQQGLAEIASSRPMVADTTLMAYSMSKTITAAAVLQLVDAQRVRLDDPVARWVPWQPYGDEITVRQLLSHTAGIPNPMPLRWVHPAAAARFDDRSALMAILKKHPRLTSRPGTRFKYSNIGYWLLGEVVAEASGQSFTSYVTTNVLARLGIPPSDLGFAIASPTHHAAGYLEKYSLMNVFKRLLIDGSYIGSYERRWLRIRDHYVDGPAFGGLVGTARGFARFLQDQLHERSLLFGDATRDSFYEQQRTTRGRLIPMTLGWHIAEDEAERCFYKEGGGGGFHCMMRLYLQTRVGMVVMCNATAFDVGGVLDAVRRIAVAS
jgi:CubicO group peptidase (beta-lactamase class C family)